MESGQIPLTVEVSSWIVGSGGGSTNAPAFGRDEKLVIVASAALRTQQREVSILQQRLSIRPISGIYAMPTLTVTRKV
jgi:hypothetical protein